MLGKMLAVAGMTVLLIVGNGMAQESPWVRYVDPKERAYTIDVPRGWQVNGGMQRRSPMQAHNVLRLRSPGGATQMTIGNVDGFTYSVLTPMSVQLGFHEGSITSPGADNLKMLNYRTGQQFAEISGRTLFGQQCQKLRLVRVRPHPGVKPRPQPNGLTQGSTAGDAFFTCEKGGHKLAGYVFSETQYTNQSGVPGGIWNGDNTYAFLTPEGKGNEAGMVLTHIVKSVQINQQWLTKELRVSAELANHALAQANAQLSANPTSMQGTFSDTSKAAQATQEEMHRLLSGFDEYQTVSGERKSVPYAAATNWWTNNKGQAFGTQGPLSPGMNAQPMRRVPPGQ
jgi:hypothetical protein